MTFKTDVTDIAKSVMDSLSEVKLQLGDDAAASFTNLENFCAMSLEILATTNPSKLKRAAQNVELRSLIAPSRQK